MTDKKRDFYLETVDRMEPDISWIDTAAGWASCSVSLKRIADALVWFKGVIIACAVLYWVLVAIRLVIEYGVLK